VIILVVLAIFNDETLSFTDNLLTDIFPGISGKSGWISVVNFSASYNSLPALKLGPACHGIHRRFCHFRGTVK